MERTPPRNWGIYVLVGLFLRLAEREREIWGARPLTANSINIYVCRYVNAYKVQVQSCENAGIRILARSLCSPRERRTKTEERRVESVWPSARTPPNRRDCLSTQKEQRGQYSSINSNVLNKII